jgi:hypothetical protein
VVYIREAHPTDAWQVEANERDGVLFVQPTTIDERIEVAKACSLRLDLTIPTLIDDMADSTDRKYYALPDRLFLIGRDGRIAFRGAPGPFGFVSDDLKKAIVSQLDLDPH